MNPMQYGLEPIDFRNPLVAPADGRVSRRGFLVTTLASGFALASGALEAKTIVTDAKGLIAGDVQVPVENGPIPAYRAVPEAKGKYPVLLVIHEISGVHEHIKDLCRRFAKLGYYAIAPEMFVRQGDVSKMTDVGQILAEVVSKVSDAQVMGDLDATVAFAKASGQADVKKLGAVGYSWGGRSVWLYAAHNPALKAGIAYYGLLAGMKAENKPADPLDLAERVKAPVLGLYALSDSYVPMEQVEKMRGALATGGSGSVIVVFPGVDHGFNADYRPTYDQAAAVYAQELALDWLKDRGV